MGYFLQRRQRIQNAKLRRQGHFGVPSSSDSSSDDSSLDLSSEDRPRRPEEAITSSLPSTSRPVTTLKDDVAETRSAMRPASLSRPSTLKTVAVPKAGVPQAYSTTHLTEEIAITKCEGAKEEPPGWLKKLLEIKRADPRWPAEMKRN